MPEFTKEEMEKMRKSAEDKMRTVDFQVDTLNIKDGEDSWGGHSGWGINSKGVITAHYNIYENGYINDNSVDDYTLYIHEQKHRDNMENGIYEYPMSWEQAYKNNMNDEISATMAELLQLREDYLQTGDISVFDKTPKLGFYKEAVKKGEIKPGSEYKEDFDKEMSFIVNGTRDMWVNNYSTMYVEQNLYFATNTYDASGKYVQYHDENYERARKIAYNIGGVDFTKYMEKDVEIPQAANAKMIEEIANNPSMQEYYHLTDAQVIEKSGLPAYDGSISLHQYKQLLQHQLAVDSYASGRGYTNMETGEGRIYSKEEVLKSLTSKETIEYYKDMYNDLIAPECPDSEKTRKECPTFDKFLKYVMSPEVERFQKKFNAVTENEAFIDKVVEYQAREYAKTGKDFPRDNPENYQKALKKLYCGAYDILKPDETKLKSELSKLAEKLQNKSSWERTMENYLKAVGVSPDNAEYTAHNLAQENKIIGGWGCFVGGPFVGAYNKVKDLKHRMTHIVDENGEEQNVGLWEKIKQKAGETVGLKKGKISNVTRVKNEPTHLVNKNAPEYPKWSKDNRVSEVQHREILDLRKPIIKQPTRSKADNQQDKPNSKGATADKMKKDTVKAQVAAKQPKNSAISSKDKTALKNIMKQDTAKAKKVLRNIGNKKTTTEKVAKIAPAVHNEKQILKNLYHKVFDR